MKYQAPQWALVSLCLNLGILGTAGCAPQRAYDGPARPRSEVSRLQLQLGSGSGAVSAQNCRFVLIDEWPIDRYRKVDVLPGLHEIAIEVSWPRRFVERIEFRADTAAGRTYQLYAQTHDPDYGFLDELLAGALGGAAPLVAPIAVVVWAIQDRATHRPLDLDSAVWLTELESGIVVWGNEPVWAWGTVQPRRQ